MSQHQQRREANRELLQAEELSSQQELIARLARRGFRTSQPMLSRDLRALSVAKQDGVYRLHEEERVTPLAALASLLRSVGPVQHLLLVRCEPGAASAVARALEAEAHDGLVGTVAGDDTVLVASAGSAAQQRVRRRIQSLL
jgi:transcriptional regulator of arginine metabolism